MHKSVLALVVVAAIADGHIRSPDDPIGNYISEWQADRRGSITVRQLLTMSSGLAPLSRRGGPFSDAWRFTSAAENTRPIILSLALTQEPGSVFEYANTSSQLLGLVVENAVGQPYADYLSSRIWQPMGLADAYLWNNEPSGFPKTYTSLAARPHDWLKLGLLVKELGRFGSRQLLPANLVAQMISPAASNSGYGWQVWRGIDRLEGRFYNDRRSGLKVGQSQPFSIDDWVFFDGFGGQRVYISQSADLVVVRLGEAKMNWDESALPNAVVSALGDAIRALK